MLFSFLFNADTVNQATHKILEFLLTTVGAVLLLSIIKRR
jgi:hypothetical protein